MIRLKPKPQRPYVPAQIPRSSAMRVAGEVQVIMDWPLQVQLGLLPLHTQPTTVMSLQAKIRKSLYRELRRKE